MKSNIKLVSLILTCIAVSFTYGAATIQYKVFPYDLLLSLKNRINPELTHPDYFYLKESFFKQHGRDNYDVVFIGDSFTDNAEWEDLFPSLTIANRGISGDRTDGVLKRLDSIYTTNAKKAFIMIGVNDFYSGYELKRVINNYKIIIDNLVNKKMHVFVQSTISISRHEIEINKKITALNKWLRKTAEKHQSVTYIDLDTDLKNKFLLHSKHSRDNIHFNGQGYAVWKNLIQDHIQ